MLHNVSSDIVAHTLLREIFFRPDISVLPFWDKPGLEPNQAQAQLGPQLRAGLEFCEAQAHQSPGQAWALSPSWAQHITKPRLSLSLGYGF